MLNRYETLVLMSPELAEENRKEIVANFSGIIERNGGAVALVDDWGILTLAYPVRKQTRGHYVRFEYSGPGPVVAELERNIRITDGLFKFVTVRLDEKQAEAAKSDAAKTEEA